MSSSRKTRGAPPPFVLWREVLASYAMPTVSAGLGGLATRQAELLMAAPTTIGGTSALVAAGLGAALRRRPVRARPHRVPRGLAAAGLALVAAAFGLAAGLAAAHWLPLLPGLAASPWPRRLPVDFAVSSAVATAVTTWRWRGSRRPASPSLPSPTLAPRPEGRTS
ncbi:hypothetical protein [Kitasatospora sp. NPDC088134]|uniref:hypothetical protein n=1 Tax=Kitasatospora sp. NPDC088134 TaxID=3364071 RepID=UPI003807476C